MKITQRKLKRIIREEMQKELLKEAVNPAAVIAQIERLLGALKASLAPQKKAQYVGHSGRNLLELPALQEERDED